MIRMYVLKVLNGYIKNLAKSQQPAKCIDKEGNSEWNLAIGKVCPSSDKRPGK